RSHEAVADAGRQLRSIHRRGQLLRCVDPWRPSACGIGPRPGCRGAVLALGLRSGSKNCNGRPTPMPYQPMENHGIVGNMNGAALVSLDGSVDWLCLPRFDSPSVFGAILDAEKGGRFRIASAAAGELRHKQYYWPETNVLVTRFLHPDGIAEVEDYMPVGPRAAPDGQVGR